MILLLTKGLIRDQVARRKLMFWIMLACVVMVAAGWLFFSDELWMRQHPWTAIGFWAVCGWLLLTAMLLALLDILAVRAMHRAARRALEKRLLEEESNKEK
jgi:hypothetical protein